MKNKRKRTNILLVLILIGLIVGSLTGVYKIVNETKTFTDNMDVERERREVVVREPKVTYTDFDNNFLREIDFDALKAMNVNATRWMYVPGTAIDDAVVQEQTPGVYKYLWSGLDGRRNGSGSYMVPAAPINPETGEMYEDDHLMILGHRMRIKAGAEWKFSHLPTRWSSAQGAKNYPYVYIYYEDRVERYRVWSMAQDVKGSASSTTSHNPEYLTPYTTDTDNYEGMLDYVKEKAFYSHGRAPDRHDKTLMMSTCNTSHVSGGRTYITSVLDAEYIYATEEVIEYE